MLSRPDPQQGGEPLKGERSEDMAALLQAAEAVASAQFAPILQMEWEESVNWGESRLCSTQPAASLSHEEHESHSTSGAHETLPCRAQASSSPGLHPRVAQEDLYVLSLC